MTAFQEHLRREARRILEGFPGAVKGEIYVVSFRVWRREQDPRYPYVAIGFNTESEVRRVLGGESSDPGTARWEYAYWLLEGFEALGHLEDDPVGSRLYVEEVRARGLWYDDDPSGDTQDEAEQEASDELLYRHFADACVELARHLHAEGSVAAALGHEVPIVLFDMDCPGWEVEATEAANPPYLVADFLEHHSGE
ncbi:hypothetical protein ACIQNU_34460 [Streptomyces sp. NPDC091292]|uniref:hypothetical protein n=1 Tax=Streptomyces sp. NPDC091292 TaxID=3365991 RepID=UPI00381CB329